MVVGPTRLGKTDWARTLGRHIYMCNTFNLSKWDNEAEYLIIDDIHFCSMAEYGRKALWGAQREITLVDKWHKKKVVQWGRPLIFLCNDGEDFRYMEDKRGKPVLRNAEMEWYKDNCVIVEVRNKLF